MRFLKNPVARSVGFLLLLISLDYSVPGQEVSPDPAKDTARAIEHFRQGDVDLAIKKLELIVKKRPNDAEAWDALATILYREGLILRARFALARVLSLRPEAADAHARLAYSLILANDCAAAMTAAWRAVELGNLSPEAHYAIAEANLREGLFQKSLEQANIALTLKPDFLPALITKSLAHSALKQYPEAVNSLNTFLELSPNDIDAETWRDQLQELSVQAAETQSTQSVTGSPLTGKQVTVKARILSKPEPQYTESARLAGVTGTIVMRAIFSADGEVKRVFVSRALGYGLTTQAIKAARLIKFAPAEKDGQPVSMFIQLEYNFNLF